METKKITMTFTLGELDTLLAALNFYELAQMNKSQTYGNFEALKATGRPDVWHEIAIEVGALWCRAYDASKELKEQLKAEAIEA